MPSGFNPQAESIPLFGAWKKDGWADTSHHAHMLFRLPVPPPPPSTHSSASTPLPPTFACGAAHSHADVATVVVALTCGALHALSSISSPSPCLFVAAFACPEACATEHDRAAQTPPEMTLALHAAEAVKRCSLPSLMSINGTADRERCAQHVRAARAALVSMRPPPTLEPTGTDSMPADAVAVPDASAGSSASPDATTDSDGGSVSPAST